MATESCTVYLELETDEIEEITVEVYFSVEPTELEGGYTFFAGGVSFEDWRTSFSIGKIQCTEDNPEVWAKYIVDKPDDVDLTDYIYKECERQGNVKIPVIKYPYQT